MDRRSVLAVLVGNEAVAVSSSYIESTRTKEIIGNGIFGTVYKGTDIVLNRSFAIKITDTDILWGSPLADFQKAKEAFLNDITVRRSRPCTFIRQRGLRRTLANIRHFFCFANRDSRSFDIPTLRDCMRMPFRKRSGVVAILFVSLPRKDLWIKFGRVSWAPNAFRCFAAASRYPWTS
jgi:hypothetical protein